MGVVVLRTCFKVFTEVGSGPKNMASGHTATLVFGGFCSFRESIISLVPTSQNVALIGLILDS